MRTLCKFAEQLEVVRIFQADRPQASWYRGLEDQGRSNEDLWEGSAGKAHPTYYYIALPQPNQRASTCLPGLRKVPEPARQHFSN